MIYFVVSVEGNSTSISSEHVAAAVNVLDLVVYYEEKMQRQTATAFETDSACCV